MVRSTSVVLVVLLTIALVNAGGAQPPAGKAVQPQPGAKAPGQAKTSPAAEKTKPEKSKPEKAKPAETGKAKPAEVDHTADNEAIEATIVEFEKAYNAGDAAAIAALFTEEAQIVNEDGETVQGREAIEEVFAELFKNEPGAVIDTEVYDLKYIGKQLAIEHGKTTLVHSPGEPAVVNDYTVLHVKTAAGKWQMALARDTPAETLDHTENLLPLSFLVGEWVDESSSAVVETVYDWSDGDKFIVGKFSVKLDGEEALTGTQRIGWDPQARKIRSWVFDSSGGFQSGLWTRVGEQWLVKYQGVNGEGEVTAGTSVMTLINADRWSWQSRDRVVGNELLEDTPEVEIVRKAPPPDLEDLGEEQAVSIEIEVEAK